MKPKTFVAFVFLLFAAFGLDPSAAWAQPLLVNNKVKPAWSDPHPVTENIKFVPGDGLAIISKDGAFSMVPRLRAQFRYDLESPEDEQARHILQIRRARLQFVGHVFGKHNKYKAEFAFSPSDQDVFFGEGPRLTPLLDFYAEFDYLRDATLRVGQYKVPFNRQRVISSGDLQLVDRGLAQREFTLDRDIGIDLRSRDLFGLGLFKYYAGIFFNRGRDSFQSKESSPMYIVRLEFLPMGDFADYVEADIERTETPKMSIGLAYAYLDEARNDRGILGTPPADQGTTDFHLGTVDVIAKYRGFSLFGELYLRDGDRTRGPSIGNMGQPLQLEGPRDGLGFFLQGGYLLPNTVVELVARYSETRPLGQSTILQELHEVGAGVSWYPGGHALKLQADYFHNWRGAHFSAGGDVLRVQLQIAY